MNSPVASRRAPRHTAVEPSRSGWGEKGYALALTALLILPIMAFTSYAVDLGAWYARADQLQRAADAAALAAAPLLPDPVKPGLAATTTLTKNGITAGGNISVTQGPVTGSTTKYFVTIKDTQANQFFSKALRPGGVTIERTATAERIQPVPMGSPRNFLGTRDLYSPAENFSLSVSGYCTRHEFGDRIATYADNNGSGSDSPGHSCVPGTEGGPSYVRKNPEYTANGYFYGIEFNSALAGNYKVEYYKRCDGFSGSFTFQMKNADNGNPLLATTAGRTMTTVTSGGTCNSWQTLDTIANPVQGTYFLQVKPDIPASKTADQSHIFFALRVSQPGGFQRCAADINEQAPPNIVYSATCPKVFALTNLGIWADVGGANPSFYLASVASIHAGKTMEVELFDSAEGADYIQLLDPNGNAVTFNGEVGYQNASYGSDGGSPASGEVAPSGGYGPFNNITSFPVGGTGPLAWTPDHNTQDGKYSNRLIRLKVQLPVNYGTLYGTKTWWKIKYGVTGSIGDRTTWTVRIKGDPVRLVPNG